MDDIKKYARSVDADAEKMKMVVDVLCDTIRRIKRECPEEYKKAFARIHSIVYGNHFSKCLAEHAVNDMVNADGTVGGLYSLEDTNSVLKQFGWKLNEYDFYYAMNMMRSDYSKLFNSDTAVYAKMAYAYLTDVDAPKGRAVMTYIWTHDL